MDLNDRLRVLADILPLPEAPDADLGQWDQPPAHAGAESLGWFAFGRTADPWRATLVGPS
jgi:hypothetical protein